MQPHEYETMYRAEDRHWWYVGLRTVMLSLLNLPRRPHNEAERQYHILDAGCGTGGTLGKLWRYPHAQGIDYSPLAVEFCHQRGLHNVQQGSVTAIPQQDSSLDLLISLDVLCDEGTPPESFALREFYRVVKPGGRLYLNLPAYGFLRGEHDVAAGVVRRYDAARLRGLVEGAGFRIRRLTYWNTLLFPIVVAVRRSQATAARTLAEKPADARSDVKLPPEPLNRVLTNLVRLEAAWLRRFDLPYGSSIACVAEKI